MHRSIILGCLIFALALNTVVCVDTPDDWVNTPTTDRLYQLVSSFDNDGLLDWVEENEDEINIRSSDGRGGLFWAYEYRNNRAVQILIDAGADQTMTDIDGKKPSDMQAGTPPETSQQDDAYDPADYDEDDYGYDDAGSAASSKDASTSTKGGEDIAAELDEDEDYDYDE